MVQESVRSFRLKRMIKRQTQWKKRHEKMEIKTPGYLEHKIFEIKDRKIVICGKKRKRYNKSKERVGCYIPILKKMGKAKERYKKDCDRSTRRNNNNENKDTKGKKPPDYMKK